MSSSFNIGTLLYSSDKFLNPNFVLDNLTEESLLEIDIGSVRVSAFLQ